MYWFTSDLHLGHANIIGHCDRPFKDVNHMNNQIIKLWNDRVKYGDTVFHIGDFCYKNESKFHEYRARLNGDIIFIQGNHDHNNGTNTPILDITIHLGGETLLLIHRPEDVSVFGGKLVLCGHVHQNWKFRRDYYNLDKAFPDIDRNAFTDYCNVGIDVNRGYPVNIQEILKEYNIWVKTGNQNIKNWV